MSLVEEDFPALYKSADSSSLKAQALFLRLTKLELISLISAAALGSFTAFSESEYKNLLGAMSGFAFFLALLLRAYNLKMTPENEWYEGRAVAESVKTLTWRYAVGAEPFGLHSMSDQRTDELFLERLDSFLQGMKTIPPTESGLDEQITLGMKNMRGNDLNSRKAAYKKSRIEDQQSWYSNKSSQNKARAKCWNLALLVLEGLGILATILFVAGYLDISLAGLVGAFVAAGVSWLQTKQHYNLSKSYALAAQELALIKAKVNAQASEELWSTFVVDAEEAISREHTMWKASRSS